MSNQQADRADASWRDPTARYDALIERIEVWAESTDDVIAAAVVGSRARVERPSDQWSDLDVVLFVTDPRPYLSLACWLDEFGRVLITFTESTAVGDAQERRVLFDGWLDVDFAVLPAELLEEWHEGAPPEDICAVLRRGIRVLVDKDGLAEICAHLPPPPPIRPPSQEAFVELQNDFWYHVVWSAKHLRRGELWWAKSAIDGHLKDRLRVMLEWHARAAGKADTWMAGRFLESWADPRAIAQLGQAFGRYEASDLWRALQNTAELFAWLARETAERLALNKAAVTEGEIVNWLREITPH